MCCIGRILAYAWLKRTAPFSGFRYRRHQWSVLFSVCVGPAHSITDQIGKFACAGQRHLKCVECAQVRASLRRGVREIIDQVGVTSILVTHDQEEAFDIADEVVIFNR